MAQPKNPPDDIQRRHRPRARTPEGREKQLVSAATDLAEDQILAGTATSQVIVHYLKLGTTREDLEKQKLKQENELLKARVKSLASMEKIEEMYAEALNAMRRYSGRDEEEYDD